MITNHVSLIGRMTKDPQISKGKGKDAWKLCRFTLACADGINQEGEKLTQFIGCKAWGTIASTMETYVVKGQLIAVSGKIVANNYEDEDGKMHYSYDVLVNELQLLGDRKADEADEEDGDEEAEEKPANNKKYNRKGKK